MNNVLTRSAVCAALVVSLSAAEAAPLGAQAPAVRPATHAPALPGTAVTHTPAQLNAKLVVEGNGVQIGGRLARFGTVAGIVSSAMAQATPAQRARLGSRVQACSFNASFTMKNVGGLRSDAVDVSTWLTQPRGPQVGKIADQGYGNPALAPGGTQTWSTAFTLVPGSYVFHLVIGPRHLNRRYAVALKASCGFGGVPQMQAPKALGVGPQPLHAPSGIPPSGGIGIAPSGGIGIARGIAPQTVKVGPGTKLSAVLALPDGAVLEGPKGRRMTVAEFKQKRMQIESQAKTRGGPGVAHGKTMHVAFARRGESLAQKIAALRTSEVAAAKRVMASPGFNRGGQLPAERTQSAQVGNRITNQARITNCALRAAGVNSVNYRSRGVVFTPGATYAIVGCGFGDRPGKVDVIGTSNNLGNTVVQIPLQVVDWSDEVIYAVVDSSTSGVGDIASATLSVRPATGAPLEQSGHEFYAARETHQLALPSQYIDLKNPRGVWEPRYDGKGDVDRGYCTNDDACTKYHPGFPVNYSSNYCAGWPAGARDVWRLDKVVATLAKSGFEIDGTIDVQNTTDTGGDNETFDSGIAYNNSQVVDMGTFASWQQNNELYVQYQGHSWYTSNALLGIVENASSVCTSSYAVTINVTGPRGVPVPSL